MYSRYAASWSSDVHYATVRGENTVWAYPSPRSDESRYEDVYEEQLDDYGPTHSIRAEYQDSDYGMDQDEHNGRFSEAETSSDICSTPTVASSVRFHTDSSTVASTSSEIDEAPDTQSLVLHYPEPCFWYETELAVASPHSTQPLGPRSAVPLIPYGIHYLFRTTGRITTAAHQPVPLQFQSKYSEFAPQLDFMRKLEETEHEASRLTLSEPPSPSSSGVTLPSGSPEPTELAQSRKARQAQRPLLPSTARPKSKKLIPVSKAAAASRARPRSPFIRTDHTTGKIIGSRTREAKKPSLACKFCRERKIACGRPPEDAEDQTCNQCARRHFKCEYRTPEAPRRRSPSSQKNKTAACAS